MEIENTATGVSLPFLGFSMIFGLRLPVTRTDIFYKQVFPKELNSGETLEYGRIIAEGRWNGKENDMTGRDNAQVESSTNEPVLSYTSSASKSRADKSWIYTYKDKKMVSIMIKLIMHKLILFIPLQTYCGELPLEILWRHQKATKYKRNSNHISGT